MHSGPRASTREFRVDARLARCGPIEFFEWINPHIETSQVRLSWAAVVRHGGAPRDFGCP